MCEFRWRSAPLPVMLQFMTIATPAQTQSLIRWHYAWYAAAALAVMVAAIASGSLWFLNFVHVFSGVLWTGIDLYLGFVLGPTMRRLDLPVRRTITANLTPRTLFLMPTVAAITGTTGWYLAVELGFTVLPWPQYGWVAAALVLLALMTIVGLGALTPLNVTVCLELQKERPDLQKIARIMRAYFFLTAAQGTMQVAMIVVMTRFRTGL
jgi:uncharacterized membrane protein